MPRSGPDGGGAMRVEPGEFEGRRGRNSFTAHYVLHSTITDQQIAAAWRRSWGGADEYREAAPEVCR